MDAFDMDSKDVVLHNLLPTQTPLRVAIRNDTLFFLVEVLPEGENPTDGSAAVDLDSYLRTTFRWSTNIRMFPMW